MDTLIAHLIAGVTSNDTVLFMSPGTQKILFHFSFSKFDEDNASLLLFLTYYCPVFAALQPKLERSIFMKAASSVMSWR